MPGTSEICYTEGSADISFDWLVDGQMGRGSLVFSNSDFGTKAENKAVKGHYQCTVYGCQPGNVPALLLHLLAHSLQIFHLHYLFILHQSTEEICNGGHQRRFFGRIIVTLEKVCSTGIGNRCIN